MRFCLRRVACAGAQCRVIGISLLWKLYLPANGSADQGGSSDDGDSWC